LQKIEALVDERYGRWEWNFGHSPQYTMSHEKTFQAGTVEMKLRVEQGIIKEIKIFGDYFGSHDTEEIERALTGIRHHEPDVRMALSPFDLNQYFLNIRLEDLLSILF
jgi:lipoate---protein ligase